MALDTSKQAIIFHVDALEFCLNLSESEFVKFRHLMTTVIQNDVDVEGFKELLDSPKWYNVKDEWAYLLLKTAICLESKEVFNYMLSLEDFPVDTANIKGETPLQIALTGFYGNDRFFIKGYYAYELLLKRDVRVDHVCYKGRTYLHNAFIRRFIRAARLLIEKGADVNAQDDEGATPLHHCVCCSCNDANLLEGVAMLLCYGADPFIPNLNGELAFDCVLRESEAGLLAQEILFYYTFDEYSCRTISLVSLLEAALKKLPFFYELVEKISTVNCNNCSCSNMKNIFKVEYRYLKLLLEKFGYAFEEFLFDQSNGNIFRHANYNEQSLQNVDLMVNTFGSVVIKKISRVNSSSLIRSLIDQACSLSLMSEIVCYFLSYGMSIAAEDMQLVYKKFGFCELFKILRQMDVEMYMFESPEIIPMFFYHVRLYNIEAYLQDRHEFSTLSGVEKLLSYSAHPKLKEFCYELNRKSLIEKAKNLPNIPLLMELARDVFREYFIKKFNITTFKQFHMMLKMLPISDTHRKIITFETKLYN